MIRSPSGSHLSLKALIDFKTVYIFTFLSPGMSSLFTLFQMLRAYPSHHQFIFQNHDCILLVGKKVDWGLLSLDLLKEAPTHAQPFILETRSGIASSLLIIVVVSWNNFYYGHKHWIFLSKIDALHQNLTHIKFCHYFQNSIF